MSLQGDRPPKTADEMRLSLLNPVCTLQLPFFLLAISLMNHGELQDKFVAEIIRLLDWCDDTYIRIGQGSDTNPRRIIGRSEKGPMSFDLAY
jgi:hypothetical protein